MSEKSKLFMAGIPTRIEVDQLMDIMSSYAETDVISYSQIEKVTGPRHQCRAMTIIGAWKKRAMRERNILLVAEPRIGYRLADPTQRINYSGAMATAGRRRLMRSATIAAATAADRLDDEQRKTREHIMTIPVRLRLAELTAPKNH
jgi:hypothetical protein